MSKLVKLADLCWEGLTLKHVSQKQIVIPYLLFMSIALLFELFLVTVFIFTSVLLYTHGLKPSIEYMISASLLICMLALTVPVLKAIVKRKKEMKS